MTGAVIAAATAATTSVAVAISPNPAFGFGIDPLITSEAVTVNVATGPYAWSQINGDTMSIVNPTSQTTSFQANLTPGEPKSGTFEVSTTRGPAQVVVYLERSF